MVNPFGPLLGNLNQLGFFQFLFPFLLILALSYGGLEYALGGAKEKRILPKSAVALISMVISFFVLNYSGGVGSSIGIFFSQIFGQGMVVAVGILMILVLLGLFGLKPANFLDKTEAKKNSGMAQAAIAIVVLLVFLFIVGAGQGLGLGGLRLDSQAWTIVIFLIIFVGVMWALGKKEE